MLNNILSPRRLSTTIDNTGFPPEWWHHHGMKMDVNQKQTDEHQLFLSSYGDSDAVASIIISKNFTGDSAEKLRTKNYWLIDYKINQFNDQSQSFSGRIVTPNFYLKLLFGLDCDIKEGLIDIGYSKSFLLRQKLEQIESASNKFNADFFIQGVFIRTGPYVNIPHPGTGHDGDPNISLFVNTDEILEKATEFFL